MTDFQKLCWYCEKNNSQDEYTVPYDIHKLIRRKGTYVIFGRSVKTKYLSKTINIPRCKKCSQIHSKIFDISAISYLVICAIFIWNKIILNNENTFDQIIIGSVLVLIFGIPIFLIISWLVKKLFGIKENRDEDYPEIANLLSQGWESGSKPYLKGENYNSK